MAKGPIGYGSPSATWEPPMRGVDPSITWCLGLGKKPDWL